VADHPLRPATRLSLGEPSPHQLADRTRTPPRVIACRSRGHPLPRRANSPWSYPVLVRLSAGYPGLEGRLSTCYSPVRRFTGRVAPAFSHDLHVSGTPPAFVLSQDQTLHKSSESPPSPARLTRLTMGGLTALSKKSDGLQILSRTPAARFKACTTIQFSKTSPAEGEQSPYRRAWIVSTSAVRGPQKLRPPTLPARRCMQPKLVIALFTHGRANVTFCQDGP
jgi:hypothetical protein